MENSFAFGCSSRSRRETLRLRIERAKFEAVWDRKVLSFSPFFSVRASAASFFLLSSRFVIFATIKKKGNESKRVRVHSTFWLRDIKLYGIKNFPMATRL
jgi:hypothetical protein